MLFNSVVFFIFFTIVTGLYFLLPHKFRWALLLIASCYFYMAFVPVYILILGFTIVVDYFAGIFIEQASGKKKLFFLTCSLVANIGVLAFFKYFNFFNENLDTVMSNLGRHNPIPYLNILLPLGLSFHTFQAMSYNLEVFRGNQKAERHFGIYALYVVFYPQLVAGPIERPQNLLHQFYEQHKFDYTRIVDGLKLMAWGLFKKIVIADRLSVMVDNVYDHPYSHHGLSFIIATVFFAFQIYCDFSGYSDMALGAAQVMGFRLMRNFNHPFISKSVTEFWRRWHISLSTWFNDYLFTPLSFKNRDWGKWGVVFGLLITFAISGLWHGANWTFVLYGLLNGFLVCAEFLTKKSRKKLSKLIPEQLFGWLCNLLTFTFACFTWIFFRSHTIKIAFHILKSIFLDTIIDVSNLLQRKPSTVMSIIL